MYSSTELYSPWNSSRCRIENRKKHVVACRLVREYISGLENGFAKKPRFFRFFKKPKNPKSPKFRFLGFFYFLVKFYTDHIKFHILIVICEFRIFYRKGSKRE